MKVFLTCALLVILVVGGVWLFKKRTAHPPLSSPVAPRVVTGDPKLLYASTDCDGGGCNLQIEVKAKNECFLGDFNLMMLDLENASDKPNFLVSVEPLLLGEANIGPMAQEMTLKEAEAGAVKTFRLPRFQRPTQLGVFLCKDSKNEGHCSGKEFSEFNDFMGQLFKGMEQGGKFRSTDHIYFFQYLFWEEEGKLAAMNDENIQMMTDEVYRHRLDYVLSKSPQFPRERQQAMDRVKALSVAVRSLPLEIKGSKLTALLPKNDPNCKKK